MNKAIKNKWLVAFFVVSSTMALASEGPSSLEPELQSNLGYFYGYSFGNMLKDGNSADADIERLIQGLRDSLANVPPALTDPQREAVYVEVRRRQALAQSEREKAQAERTAAAEVSAAANLEAGVAFLVQNAKRPEVNVTPSGLQYEVIEDKEGPTAPADSTVVVNYKGTFTGGEIFDQSQGNPVEFGLQQVISGWTEGLQLMSAGDKFRLFLHPNLAYGAGSVGQIPPNSVLIFDIELLEIK